MVRYEQKLDMARNLRVPSERVYFLNEDERLVLKDASEKKLKSFIKYAEDTYRYGILENEYKNLMRIDNYSPNNDPYVVLEFHIDARNVSEEVEDVLYEIGFGYDDFYKFYPVEMNKHYTAKYVVPKSNTSKIREYTSKIWDMYGEAKKLIDENKLQGYLEVEFYNSDTQIKYPKEHSNKSIDDFTYRSIEKELKGLSTNHFIKTSISPGEYKVADIHFKAGDVKDLIKDLDKWRKIKTLIEGIGFYEVITGHNIVYTGQFTDKSSAIEYFEVLKDVFNRYGGIAEITLEQVPPTGFYTKPGTPIPYLVGLK